MNKRHLIFFFLLLFGGGLQRAAAQCITSAGIITNTGDYELCANGFFEVINQGAVLDSGDIRLFVIHDGTTNQLGNILVNSPSSFLFNFPGAMQVGTPYQIAVLVGEANGQNQIDLNDPCLSMAGGATITLTQPLTLDFSTSATLTCGDTIEATAIVNPPGGSLFFDWAGPVIGDPGSPTVQINTPGTYYLSVVDSSSNCFIGDTLLIIDDGTFPTVSISASNPTCNEAVFAANSNDPAVSYLWSNGVTNQSIVVNDQGVYCVTVTNSGGCTAAACRFFLSGLPLQVEIESFGQNICIDSLGLFAFVQGGVQPFSYLWSNGDSSSWQLPTGAGTYCVTVVDGTGCSASDCLVIENDIDDCGTLEGKVFADYNTDCLFNSGDLGLQGITLLVENSGGDVYFAYTAANGDYAISLPPGDYTVTPVLVNSPWTSCLPSYAVTVPFAAPVTQDVPLQADELCPALQIDIVNNLLRRCNDNNYYDVSYCNTGTTPATGAYVDTTLDPLLSIVNSDLPYTDLGNNTYRFDLGDVAVNTCGNFYIKVSVSCNAQLGETPCVEAVIYPNDPCPAPDSAWSGASVRLQSECTGSELIFTARNTGSADMTIPLNYVISEDAVMLKQAPGAPLQKGEARTVFTTPANGATWRIEVEQEPHHPGMSMPSLTVEGCSSGQNFSLGFVNQFPVDDNDPWIDIDCNTIVGSFDPNDKQGFPVGYGAQHYVRPGTDIEYLIRFQNTGTDTAFRVVIRDTLSQWLDPASVTPGAASHPYTFRYYGDGHLKFEFDPIALPDSNVNQEGSQGYVSFRVSQKANVPLETDIYNSAAIYFDGNEPVITNTTVHRVGEDFMLVSTWTPLAPGLQLKVMPNPAHEYAVLQLDGIEAGSEWQVELMDATGRPVLRDATAGGQWRLERGALPAGLYLVRIVQAGKVLGTGKVVLR